MIQERKKVEITRTKLLVLHVFAVKEHVILSNQMWYGVGASCFKYSREILCKSADCDHYEFMIVAEENIFVNPSPRWSISRGQYHQVKVKQLRKSV